MEGLMCEAFQNIADARIKAKVLQQRRIFCEWALEKLREDYIFYRKIELSIETEWVRK